MANTGASYARPRSSRLSPKSDGQVLNVKRVFRHYREEGLAVR